ncbi:MAG: hypothetical protein AB7O38_19845 [Pirellulaceae bacterium]
MNDERPKWRRIQIVAAIGLVVMLAQYVAGYICLGAVDEYPDITYRTFRSPFECRLFVPLAWLECKTRQTIVALDAPVYYDPTGHLHDGRVVKFIP